MKFEFKRIAVVNLSVFVLVASMLQACGNEKVPAGDAGQKSPDPMQSIQKDLSGWNRSELVTPNGGVHFTRLEMPDDQKAYWQRQYKQTDLIQVPIDPGYNVSLFKIKNVSEWENTVFIAPRIFAYNSANGGRIAPYRNDDGTISLPFPVVMIDGTKSTITEPNGNSVTEIPKTMLISENLAKLNAELDAHLGRPQILAPLPGCPKQIIVKVGDKEYDATPADLARGDYCQMNMPFNIALRIPEREARYLLEKALYASAVNVRAVYETRVAFTVSRFELDFNKEKLFTALEAEIGINGGHWLDADLKANVTRVVRAEAFKVSIQGDVSSYLDTIINQAIKEFFEPFRPDPNSGMKECSGLAAVCVRLNYSYSHDNQTFHAEWQQSTSTLTGQNYLTWATLQPLQDHVVSIGNPGQNATGSNSSIRPRLRNDGSSLELGLTVSPGDLLEITPTSLYQQEFASQDPIITRNDNPVCVAEEPVYQTHCTNSGSVRGEPTCTKVQVGTRCTQSVSHWSETTTFALPASTYATHPDPVGQFGEIFDGLYLKFTWRSNGPNGTGELHQAECPLNLFAREGDGKSLTVRIENQPKCQIFSGNANDNPMLHLENRIVSPKPYIDGTLTRYWDGRVEDRTRNAVATPIIDFSGTIAIKAYAFGAAFGGGSKAN